MENELKNLVSEDEKILYEGKPNKKCFVFESIFNRLLPFAIIWLIFDSIFLKATLSSDADKGLMGLTVFFILIHLMPVWIYLSGVIFSFRKYKNTYYIITDGGIYVSSGVFKQKFNHKTFAELSNVHLHRGIFDQMFNVGDIKLTSSQFADNVSDSITISSISNYQEVYNLVRKLQKDIYTDVMYPNDQRPPENHGYKTEYKG